MRNTWKLFLGLTSLILSTVLPSTGFAQSDTIHGIIAKISDGDTVHVRDGQKKYKVRMTGMDTPELHLGVPGGVKSQGWWAEAATEHLESLIPLGSRVKLKIFGFDAYGRVLGRIIYKNQDVNLQMVESGWAAPYAICSGDDCNSSFPARHELDRYAQACESARSSGKGIFNKKDPLKEMPFEFRLRVMKRKPDKFVGDIRNRELLHPNEYKKIDLCNRLFFFSADEAEKLGYSLD